MLKYLAAILLAVLTATPAMAQMSGAEDDASAGSGAMEGDAAIQEEQIPDQSAPGEGLDTQESQMPATGATGDPSETQLPDAQSGDESPGAQDQSDQGGAY